MWGYCEPFSTPRPAGPFRDIAARIWPASVGMDLDITFLPDRILAWMSGRARVLVVEDAHWIDTASADVLRFLGRRLLSVPATVLVTTRDDGEGIGALWSALGDLGPGSVDHIRVPALTESAVLAMVADSGLAVSDVMRLTGGNAFLVTELVAMADGRPGTVQASVAARMARLPPPGREVVELASVVPGRMSADLLGASWPDIDDGVRQGLLRVDGASVQFRHELVRQAVEESLPPGRRAELHARILARLDRLPGAEPTAVAHHARLANDRTRALAAERLAADRAARLGSHREAAAHARRAAQDAESVAAPADQAALLLDLAERERSIAHDSDARAAAERGVRISASLDDPALHSRALRVLSRHIAVERESLRLSREAVEVSHQPAAAKVRAAALANLALSLMLSRQLSAAVTVGEQAIAIAQATGDVASEVAACNAVGSALLLQGDRSGERPLRRAIHLAARSGLEADIGHCYANLVSAAGEARLYEQSAAAHVEALRYFVARDLDSMAGYTTAWHARCLFEQGRWAEALAECDAVLAEPHRATAIAAQAANTVLARVRTRRGDPEVEGPLAAAQAYADTSGSLQRLAPVVAARAEYHWLTGRPLPIAELRTALALAVERDNAWAIGELGHWLSRAGEPAPSPMAAAAPFRRWAEGDLDGAAAAWLELGCPYEAADAWTASTDPERVRRAWELFGELGAAPGRTRAARRLRELGVRSIPRGPRPATADDPDGLTAREREVASLLRGGLTDPEIAFRLHLSVRTVGHHVSAVLGKTGARTRRDLREP